MNRVSCSFICIFLSTLLYWDICLGKTEKTYTILPRDQKIIDTLTTIAADIHRKQKVSMDLLAEEIANWKEPGHWDSEIQNLISHDDLKRIVKQQLANKVL